jgi:hypothetical protein
MMIFLNSVSSFVVLQSVAQLMSMTTPLLETSIFSLLQVQFDVVVESVIKCCNVQMQHNVNYFQFYLLLGCAFGLKLY